VASGHGSQNLGQVGDLPFGSASNQGRSSLLEYRCPPALPRTAQRRNPLAGLGSLNGTEGVRVHIVKLPQDFL